MVSRVLNWVFLLLLGLMGVYLSLLGGFLVYLGDTVYYLLTGLATLVIAVYYKKNYARAVQLYGLLLGLTVLWGLYESDGALLSLLPRLAMWMVLGLWLLTPWAGFGEPAKRRWVSLPLIAGALALLVLAVPGYEQYGTGTERDYQAQEGVSDWRHYGNTTGGTRFASLDQINRDTVGELEEVWRVRTGVKHDFKATPLQVDGRVYLCAAENVMMALDDATGETIWRYDPEVVLPGDNQYARSCRGVSYYEQAGADKDATCSRRVITGTLDARLIAVDADTGRPCDDFGSGGSVDLRKGLSPHLPQQYFISSPPLIAGDLIVVGGLVFDSQRLGMPSGVVRAYSATTGEFAWAWDMGRPGDNGMPPEGEYFTPGTPNVWTMMSYDPELDLVYAPTGNANPDYYGGERRSFDDEYSSSLVALNAADGSVAWSFQTVHHDIWDYDLPAQPSFVDVDKDGERVPALAVPTKMGEIFLLDRRDGTPVHPVEERPVPQDPVAGDYLSPTQPFSSVPSFRPDFKGKDMWGLTPLDQLLCRVEFKMMRNEGSYTPPSPKGTFLSPGNFGGFNWGGVSIDADNGLLVAAPMILAHRVLQVTPEQVTAAGPKAAALLGQFHPAVDWTGAEDQREAPEGYVPHDAEGEYDYKKINYYGLPMPFLSRFTLPIIGNTGVPCFEPPWSKLAVIDLNTNELLWSRPVGSMKNAGPFNLRSGLPFDVGVAVRAGTLTTRGGLTFVSSTMDSTVRAFDVRSGEKLWESELPGNGQATPMSYIDQNGRQMVIVTVPNPSWVYPRDPNNGTYSDSRSIDDGKGGYVIAYALKREGTK